VPADDPLTLEIALLLDAISARYGYDLRAYAPESMRRRVLHVLDKFGIEHLGVLQHRVVHDATFMSEVLGELTVRTSEMFRDPSTFAAFRSEVVPLLRAYPLIRVWHAGCANGEEVYSTAILLAEEGLYDRTQIYATDLSPSAIAEAQQGIYPARSVEKFTENYVASGGRDALERYYTAAYDGIVMKEWLRKNILFFHHDLVTDHVFGEMHVIFCRNVFIYFSTALKEQVTRKLVLSLMPNGFLCLGRNELLPPGAGPLSEFVFDQRIYRLSYLSSEET
jgi:chemotaxis protein methyltransferase CheR